MRRKASRVNKSSRANSSRGEDAKPGIFAGSIEDRPAADPRRRFLPRGVFREGEPGALHRGPDAHRVRGPQRRRRNAVVTKMRTMLRTQGYRFLIALSALT